jgi:hypothetical protein
MPAVLTGVKAEPWECLAWQVYDRIEAERQRRGKAAAAELAQKALEAIAPADGPARKEPTNE